MKKFYFILMKPNNADNFQDRVETLLKQQEGLASEIIALRQMIIDLRKDFSHLLPIQEEKLSPEEEEIFVRLESLGEELEDLKIAERELAALENREARKSVVNRLKVFLKNLEYGIETKNGHTAAPIWQKDAGRPNGGYMRLQYTDPDSGKSVSAESHAKIPKMILRRKPDLRKSRRKN